MFNFNVNTTISTTTTTSTSTSTITTITNTMNNNNMNRRTRQRVEWSKEEIRLLINQRRHRNLEYYRTPGRSRTAFWNSVASGLIDLWVRILLVISAKESSKIL